MIFEVSSLNRWDKLKLECAISSQYIETYNCHKCLNIRREEPEQNKAMRLSKGCFSNMKSPLAIMEDGVKVYLCVGRMYSYNEINLLNEYKLFSNNKILPEDRHINFQNSKTMEAFEFISMEIIKNKEIQEKEAAQNGKRSHSKFSP